MNDESFSRLQELTLRALALPAEARAAFLDEECREAPELRVQIERLLAREHDRRPILDPDLLGRPALSLDPTEAMEREAERLVGVRIEQFRIDAVIGMGGMGVVYRAHDLTLDRAVALKFLRGENWREERLRERFLREARAAAGLNHPAICPVYDTGEYEGHPFLVMAHLEGETLKERIRRGPLPVEEALRIATQIAAGLEAAHAKEIIHRDIKSANVMIGPDGSARILDFGLARGGRLADLTRTGEIQGTVAYMSPEQARNRDEVDARTDLWSLGVVLFEMLAGSLPFEGEHDTTVLVAILEREPQDLPPLGPDVPRGCRAIIERALQKDPAARYPDAATFRRDLELLCQSPAIRFPGSTARAQAERWSRRVAVWIGAAAALAALAWAARAWLPGLGSTASLPEYHPRQITTDPAWEGEPSLSPDGSRIAFTTSARGNNDIAVIDAGGGNPVVLCPDPAEDDSPAWFPDGSRIAFCSRRGGRDGIWITRQYGDGATLLIDRAVDPAVSPDGQRIAFARIHARGWHRIWVCSADRPADSVQVSQDGSGLLTHRNPSWSPDGKRVCYQTETALYLVAAAGDSPARALTDPELIAEEPAWSADGRFVYYSSFRDGTRALWRARVRGGEPQRFTLGTGVESHPNLDRAGDRFAYATNRGGSSLVLRNLETNAEQGLTTLGSAVAPAISPDGRWVVFPSKRAGQYLDLWRVRIEQGQAAGPPERLTSQAGDALLPVYAPDGRWIAYYGTASGHLDLWLVPAAGGAPTQLTADSLREQQPAWAPDSRALVFARDRDGVWELCKLPVEDGRAAGEPVVIPTPGLRPSCPAVSADGRWIVFRGGFSTELAMWMIPFDGSARPRRLGTESDFYLSRWPRGADRIYASKRSDEELPILTQVSVVDGEVRPVEPPVRFGPAGTVGMFDVAFDAPWLVYERQEALDGDIWLLEAKPGAF